MVKNENVENITINEWEKFYEKLFGGFEDLDEEDSFSEEEKIPDHLKTKQGYSKEGGFIVSDGEEDEDYVPENSDELEELSEYDSNDNIDGDNEEEEEEHHDDDEEDDEEEAEEDDEEDYEEDDEEDDDYDDDDVGSELSEEDYIEEA